MAELSSQPLQIGGVTPLTTIDFPGRLAAVIFCQGCPWRCRYCQNLHLLSRNTPSRYSWPDILSHLRQRISLLDGVVFSGGEPTLQTGLAAALDEVIELGFETGLHTAGCYPDRLQQLLPWLDWVGLDIKALAEDYPQLTGVPGSGDKAWESLRLLLQSKTDFEVRITVHSQFLPQPRLMQLLERLAAMNVPRIALQQCRPQNMIDLTAPYPRPDWQQSDILATAERLFEHVELRS
ncbi:MAG: anaerobic ribonucleoside-triphosphate reductase activating protein [Chromatiales bacterium]|jgi:pyruvate formate lyase activating enzyme